MDERSLHVEVHFGEGMFWAQVGEWGGCLPQGDSLDELVQPRCAAIGQAATGPLPAPPRSRSAHREWGPPRFGDAESARSRCEARCSWAVARRRCWGLWELPAR